ncbi:MAG: ral nucleoside transport system permease protein [Solirubrobacteraceae bacterium]|jgi:simple sugar transport system permease protein|nr:ral nucleoside transport system permease protein [Solirubrobacteraceae bacterium]
MSTVAPPPEPVEPQRTSSQVLATQLAEHLRAGGWFTAVLTTIAAFFAGGLVVLVTGRDPISTYNAIWQGTGLDWIFPWVTGDDRTIAALNLQQTLLATGPLILAGLAVALAFRAGLFNIGGQGQYIAGSVAAVWVGSSFADMPTVLHIVLAILAALAGGAIWGGIAGVLRATTGANEVITTIMLNWIALWVGVYLFGQGGPLQNSRQPEVPVSDDVVPGARLHVFWGDPELQGLHIGLFIALVAAIIFGIFIRRSTRGYEARAVGLSPEAARYGGIRVGPTYVWVMALCGLFAGLAGAIDVLGWQFRIATNDIQVGQIGFLGIAVALLGRNTALGTCIAALLFGALVQGTSTRNLDPAVFDPALAQNLTLIIQGLVILFVTADAVIIWLVRRRRRSRATAEAGT